MPSAGEHNEPTSANPTSWGSLAPYVQLIRALLPRTSCVTVFDAKGALRFCSETTTGPDLMSLVERTLESARTDLASSGLSHTLDGNVPVYLCWLRDAQQALAAIVAIQCRPGGESESRTQSFVHSLVRPALECLRRDLLSHTAIEDLNHTIAARDDDLELLLADGGDAGTSGGSGPDELKGLVQSAVDHLKCHIAALIVPDKSIALMRTARECRADGQLLARTHRQLIAMANMRAEPTIINRIAARSSLNIEPYRILCCPVRRGGRTLGVLALFREPNAAEFVQRDARFAEVYARRAASLVVTHYDAATGLYTRAALEHRLRTCLTESAVPAGIWSALYLDIDQLHAINESCGMHVGDRVIAQLGELLRLRLPPGALAARLAGDRFAVLLPSATDDAERFAEGLRAGAEQISVAHADAELKVSISVGVACLAAPTGELTHALAAAEMACKAAKELGRNCVAVYQPDEQPGGRRRHEVHIAARLRDALATDGLRLEAQLIVPFDASAAARPHYELLVRMLGDDGSRIGPDKFLAAAQRHQLMPALDRWVIERALTLLAPHADVLAARPAVFAFNCSAQSLSDEGFGDFVVGALVSSGLDPAGFCLELTENAALADLPRAEALIRRLRRLGCGVALDDFGTGPSSLLHLRQLPVSHIKIDGSFVREVLKDERNESLVRSIAQLARGMSIATVAECVETDEIRARLATLGVDYAQGFAIGRPEPLDEVLAWLPMLAAAAPAYSVDLTPAPLERAAKLA